MSSQLINELIVTVCHYDYELKRGSVTMGALKVTVPAWPIEHGKTSVP